jgi:tetratricopeptide (TPR) repeat protein
MKRILILLTIALCVGSTLGHGNLLPSVQDNKTAMDYLEAGSVYFLKDDFKKAIPPYQKALDLEKAHRTLDKNLWFVLVDNLGMSYGITGDLKKAKEVFEYGISEEPEYPLFYYNMACTYAEMENMEKAIEYLKLAFERKENRIRGEEMPNPATDSSFERFMKNDKFLAALQELKRK